MYGSAAVAQALLSMILWMNSSNDLSCNIGQGKRLFAEDSMPAVFALTDHQVTSNGVVLSCYQRAGEVKTGLVGE